MSKTAKRIRSLIITILAIAAVDIALTYASGVPTMPNAPRPKGSGVPTMPNAPRPADSGVPTMPNAPRP